MTTAAAGALLALFIVGGFLALDRTVLHIYSPESASTVRATATPRLIPFDDCHMGAGPENCAAVHPDVLLRCKNPGPSSSNADCLEFEAVPLPQQAPSSDQQYERPQCGYGEYYDTGSNRCVTRPWACADSEEYDYLRKRCVPKEPSPSDCGLFERFDYMRHRCVPSPSSCTSEEEYDSVLDRCVPME